MSAPAWLHGLSASSSDTSAGRNPDARRLASSSVRPVAGGLRRAVAALLLGLPLLLGFAEGVQAQEAWLEFTGCRIGHPGASGTTSGGFDGTYVVGEGQTVYCRVLRSSSDGTLSVSFGASGGTATYGQDYQLVYRSITMGATATWVGVKITADNINDDMETFTLKFTGARPYAEYTTGSTVNTKNYGTVQITIRDNTSTDPGDYPVKNAIGFVEENYTVTEGDVARGTVELDAARGIATAISLSVTRGSADPGVDYTAGPYSLTIPAGRKSAQFAIPTTEDQLFEAVDEDFGLQIDPTSLPVGYGVWSGRENTTITIEDDEVEVTFPTPTHTFTVAEDEGELVATVNFSRPLPESMSLKLLYTDLSATGWNPDLSRPAAYDYEMVGVYPNLLPVPAGAEEFTFRIPIRRDNVYEDNELFQVKAQLSAVANGAHEPSASVIIRAVDPEVDFQEPAFTAHEGGDAVVVFRAVNIGTDELLPLQKPVALHVAVTGGTATAGTDYQAGPWTLTIPKGASKHTLRIPIHADSVSDDGETIELAIKRMGTGHSESDRRLADASGALLAGHDHVRTRYDQAENSGWAEGAATVTIQGDTGDAGPIIPSVSIEAGPDVTEGADATFTLTAKPAPPVAIDVVVHVEDATGGHVAAEHRGLQTVSVPATGTAVLAVPTQINGPNRAGAVTVAMMGGSLVFGDDEPDYVASNDIVSVGVDVPPVPDTPVSNLQVSAVDDAGATATWDPVEHATGYRGEYEGQGADPASYTHGAQNGITGTSWTFQHDASEAMTLTITVTPTYHDEHGQVHRLDDLAGTATLDVAPGGSQTAQTPPQPPTPGACVSAELLAHVEHMIRTNNAERWTRVLKALKLEPGGITLAEVREIYERRKRNGWSIEQWEPVLEALECLELAGMSAFRGVTPVPALPLMAQVLLALLLLAGGARRYRRP